MAPTAGQGEPAELLVSQRRCVDIIPGTEDVVLFPQKARATLYMWAPRRVIRLSSALFSMDMFGVPAWSLKVLLSRLHEADKIVFFEAINFYFAVILEPYKFYL